MLKCLKDGDLDEIKKKFEEGCPIDKCVNDTKMTPLAYVCSLGMAENEDEKGQNYELLSLILSFHPNVNHQDDSLKTPLHHAV